jgi:outer membrane protein OmpA-like peptidoglycan-associated protein
MDDAQQNESNTLIAWVVGIAAAIAVAVALIFSFVGAFGGGGAKPAAAPAAEQQAPVALVEVDQPPPLATGDGIPALLKLHFEVGKADLPADAASQVAPLVDYLKGAPEARLGISGFHDKSGDPAANRELAKNRALATRALLVNAGAPADRLILVRPQETEGGADDADARRVEVYPTR